MLQGSWNSCQILSQSSESAVSHGGLPLGPTYMWSMEIKALLAKCLCPCRLYKVFLESSYSHSLCYPSCPAFQGSWKWFFQPHFLSLSPILCIWFCGAVWKGWGPCQVGDLTCGLTGLLALSSISGSCSHYDLLQVSVTCCDVMWSNLSFKLGCDSSLFLWDCIILEVLQ